MTLERIGYGWDMHRRIAIPLLLSTLFAVEAQAQTRPIPLREDTTPLNATLENPGNYYYHFFGSSADVDGQYSIVGAPNEKQTGSAFIFDLNTGEQLHELRPPRSGVSYFGDEVVIDGNFAVVSGMLSSDNPNPEDSSTFIFDVQSGELLHELSTGVAGRSKMDIHNGAVIVGTGSNQIGSEVRVFDLATGEVLSRFIPQDVPSRARIGKGVALNNNFALVNTDPAFDPEGPVLLFDRVSGEEVRRFLPDDLKDGMEFGSSLSLTDDLAIIGANGDSEVAGRSGAVYLFDLDTGDQLAKLVAPDAGISDRIARFGSTLAVAGRYAVIGAPGHAEHDRCNGACWQVGAAYVYDILTEEFISQVIPPEAGRGHHVGLGLGYDGSTLILGGFTGAYTMSLLSVTIPEPSSLALLSLTSLLVVGSRPRLRF